MGALIAGAAVDLTIGIIDQVMSGFGKNSGRESSGQIVYGVLTNQQSAYFHNENVSGPVVNGITLVQSGNNYARKA